jgi:hypothetical protein
MDIRKNKDGLKDILEDFSSMLKLIGETKKAEEEIIKQEDKDKKARGGLVENKKYWGELLIPSTNIEKEIRQQPSLRETLINEYRKKLKDGGSTSKEDEDSLRVVIQALTGQLSLQPSEYELLDKLLNELKDKYGGK